jgi:signal transduction histidine kinase
MKEIYNIQARILVVDDEISMLERIVDMLLDLSAEIEVVTATNGKEALEYALSFSPDIIITDWDMPIMNGIELIRALKLELQTREIPIIMATAFQSSARLAEAISAGAVDYIRKPIDSLELQSRVYSMLMLSRAFQDIKHQNEEILRQQRILEDQAIEIVLINTSLLEANREKNEVIGIVAHDLKNPISGILLTAETIQKYYAQLSGQEVEKQMLRIMAVAERMKAIVMNLLDIQRIESGQFQLNIIPISVKKNINEMIAEHAERAIAKEIHINLVFPDTEIAVLADYSAFHEVMDNVVSNALKFSFPQSQIAIEVMVSQDSSVRICVKDGGPGLTTEDQSKLFGKFMRLSAQPTGGEHSTGLGLSIVKKLVEAMNGRIWCESEVGKGATFIIELQSEKGYTPI